MSNAAALPQVAYKGTPKLLVGIVLGVLTFWLFAGSMGTIAQDVLNDVNSSSEEITATQMNFAVSVTALVSGLFIVLVGGLADRVGRVRIAITGNLIGILGSLLVVLSPGDLAWPLMLSGRALQGLSAAFIMPATMALVRTYWEGRKRQSAVSWWSIGSWGGSGCAALLGGYLATNTGWQWIFVISIIVSATSTLLIWGTPESKVVQTGHKKFDVPGLLTFMVTTLSLMIVIIFGRQLGWTSPTVLGLALVAVVAGIAFVILERRNSNPFIDFKLFRNRTFTGATLSNFIINATIGLLIVSQQMLQLAGPNALTPWEASQLTIGYAVTIIAFIKVGEKLLQRLGPRKPMIWGTLIVALAAICLMPTNLLVGQYVVFAFIAYALFGLGLAFYATPSTDAALTNLPPEQSGAGAGIYKMASSLGSAIGAAVSLTIFTSIIDAEGLGVVGDIIVYQGTLDNLAVRQAGMVTFAFNLVITLIALLSIILTVPKGRKYNDEDDLQAEDAEAAAK